MNMRVSKEEMAIMLPTSLSTYTTDDLYVPAAETARPTLMQRLMGALSWLGSLPARRAVLDELSCLSDHELADIGLNRSDLPRVFDPSFAAQQSAERGRIGGLAAPLPTRF
jgi:uncharacterized protein YjiS (DUF1127 family)